MIIRAASLDDPSNSERAVRNSLLEHDLQPLFVVVEECDDGVVDRLRERLVLGGEHAAETHSPAPQRATA